MSGRGHLLRTLAGIGVLAAGAAIGVASERAMARRLSIDSYPGVTDEPIADEVLTVTAADGTHLHVEIDQGPPGAPTVIFTHGYGMALGAWPSQRASLRDLARVVLWDHRGHGRSAKGPIGSTIDTLGSDLGRVLDATAPTGPVVLVGHSMGGMTIMALADQRPQEFGDRVRGVAFLATSAGGIREVNLGLPTPVARVAHNLAPIVSSAGKAALAPTLDRARQTSTDLGLMLTRAYAFGTTVPPDGPRLVSDLLAGTPIDVLADLLPAIEDHDKVLALHALGDTDVLVMVGDSDLLTPPEHSMEIVRHVPGAELVILPGVGHMIGVERPDLVDAHVRALVMRVADRT